jgi:hypothetical protein
VLPKPINQATLLDACDTVLKARGIDSAIDCRYFRLLLQLGKGSGRDLNDKLIALGKVSSEGFPRR